jgi:hypothetical protein
VIDVHQRIRSACYDYRLPAAAKFAYLPLALIASDCWIPAFCPASLAHSGKIQSMSDFTVSAEVFKWVHRQEPIASNSRERSHCTCFQLLSF